MKKQDVKQEASPILARTMRALLGTVQEKGRPGSDVRRAVGDVLAHADALLYNDMAGAPVADCFEKARLAGVSVVKLAEVLLVTLNETPVTSGGTLTKYSLAMFCLSVQARLLADVVFESRQDVDLARARVNNLFALVEEAAADAMDATTYQATVRLHGAVVRHLIETERPLPRMLSFTFYRPMPTLVAAYRLYDDASRSDDLRLENKVVHPAFMKQDGRAMSA